MVQSLEQWPVPDNSELQIDIACQEPRDKLRTIKVKEWSTNYFKGYMDEFKVYAYPMTAEEIKAASSA